MRNWIAVACVLAVAGAGWAQRRVPQQQATRFARMFAEHAAKISEPPLKTDVDPEKACALGVGEARIMLIPEKGLSEDTFRKASQDVQPVGQLWMRLLVPAMDGKAVPEDRLRIVTIPGLNNELPLSLVGVRKVAGDQLELVLYGKDREPFLRVPLRKAEVKQEQEPVDLNGKEGENHTGILTLKILGKYEAQVMVAKSEK
jgi:hypothetical protein